MLCPNDGATELVADTLDRVAIHDCPKCGGIWLVRDNDAWFAAAEASGTLSAKKCAECGEPMRTIRYPESNVEIEVCVADHGVWLDKGEFDKIVGTLESADGGSPAPSESRWSEIKDLVATVRSLETRFGTEHPTIAAAINAASRIGL